MNKKGVSKLLWYIFEILIAAFFIILAIYFINKLIIIGVEEEDLTKIYFEELNNKIEKLNINQEIEQIIEFQDKNMLIAFNNNQDVTIPVKLKGSTIEQNFLVKKPLQCIEKGCLCLCKTEAKKYPEELDCKGEEDICKNYLKEIINNQYKNNILYILEKGVKNLKITKMQDKININF